MPGGWISIPGWRRFQHYDPAKRQPPWIKTYLELLHDDGYLGLTPAERGILSGIWLAYAASRCRLRFDTASISRRIGAQVTGKQLAALVHAGFVEEVASAALADGYHDASAALASRAPARSQEAEAETEAEDLAGRQAVVQDPAAEPTDEAAGLPAGKEPEDEPEPIEPNGTGPMAEAARAELRRLREARA